MTEIAFAQETMGMHVGSLRAESGREEGHITVARWDADASDWVSRKFGGEGTGKYGFIQPNSWMFHKVKVDPYSVTQSLPHEHNLITTVGWNQILVLAFGGGGTTYASASCRLGVGTSTVAASASQTDIAGATIAGRYWQPISATPTTATGTGAKRLVFTATVGTGDANFAWQEWGLDQGTTTGSGVVVGALLNRAVSNQGTKVSGQTWTATCNLDFT